MIFLCACTKEAKLKDLDIQVFKNDLGGCSNQRIKMLETLKANKEAIKGVISNDISKLLGKPDIDQLADRNQKYYIYFLEKGEHCNSIQNKSNAKSMAIRFSAIGLATEITFQNGTP
ncbi:MAG: hypothetical protein KA313_06590 [Pseudarcicella sp.]|nr:hypothetical protein [Pseudarcicella sp.]MBP6410748.1 hypothetical protein [Pseudarcicella sp.]